MHNKEYRIFKKVLLHIALLIVVLISIFPFIWMLTGATNKSVDVTSGALHFGKSLGENWANLQSSANVFLVFLNSMKITLIYTFISILICSMAGYGFEKYRSKGKNIVYSLFLFSMMIPFSAQMIPLFKMASKANMLNSHTAVILPTLAMPFLVFFFFPCLRLLCRLRSVNVSHCPCNHTYYHCIPDNAEAICRRHCRFK